MRFVEYILEYKRSLKYKWLSQ